MNAIIRLYEDLATAIVTETAGGWIISTFEERTTYQDKAKMIEDMEEDLNYIRESYEASGEIEEYKAAERRAGIY